MSRSTIQRYCIICAAMPFEVSSLCKGHEQMLLIQGQQVRGQRVWASARGRGGIKVSSGGFQVEIYPKPSNWLAF